MLWFERCCCFRGPCWNVIAHSRAQGRVPVTGGDFQDSEDSALLDGIPCPLMGGICPSYTTCQLRRWFVLFCYSSTKEPTQEWELQQRRIFFSTESIMITVQLELLAHPAWSRNPPPLFKPLLLRESPNQGKVSRSPVLHSWQLLQIPLLRLSDAQVPTQLPSFWPGHKPRLRQTHHGASPTTYKTSLT